MIPCLTKIHSFYLLIGCGGHLGIAFMRVGASSGPFPRTKWRSENPWPRLPKWLRKFFRISSRKHDEMSSFCLNNGFKKTNRATSRWRQPPKKPFHHVSHDKILHDSWSAALARGFSDRQFEQGEGPGDEVGCMFKKPTLTFGGCQFMKAVLVIWWTILPVLIL